MEKKCHLKTKFSMAKYFFTKIFFVCAVKKKTLLLDGFFRNCVVTFSRPQTKEKSEVLEIIACYIHEERFCLCAHTLLQLTTEENKTMYIHEPFTTNCD